jgi:hypothetical protein
VIQWLLLILTWPLLQGSGALPAYVREGDRVEQEFRAHRDDLAQFHSVLRSAIQEEAPPESTESLLSQLLDAPPQTGVYGYQILPRIAETPSSDDAVSSFTYSWAITEGYITGETEKIRRARAEVQRVRAAVPQAKPKLLSEIIGEYRNLLRNQRTIDQYIQYNRFWQRSIAQDRPRFDQLTELYGLLRSGNSDTTEAIRKVLGKPQAPGFIRIRREGSNRITLHVPVYTDLEDDTFLSQAETVVEEMWRTEEAGIRYRVEVEFKKRPASRLYDRNPPKHGDHIDMSAHVGRFPLDGGVLTTGAEFTYGGVGRYIALGPGDLAPRIFAHEFGHVLGFTDGYVRGYRDLGEKGFEILELTSFFDDIMSAPRQGRVQPGHFKLLIEALR